MKTKLTLEESARLIELGIDLKMASEREFVDKTEINSNQFLEIEEYPRFTLADIISILPTEIIADTIMGEDFPCALTIRWDENRKVWHCAYECLPHPLNVGISTELIDALYQLLIWVIESGYVKPNKDN